MTRDTLLLWGGGGHLASSFEGERPLRLPLPTQSRRPRLPLPRLIRVSDRRAARQSFWLGAILAVQLLTALAQLSLSARILGPEGLGALFTIMAATTLLFGLLTLPGDEVVVTHVTRGLAEGKRDEAARILRYALCAAFGMRLICFGLIVLTVPLIELLLSGQPANWGRTLFDLAPAGETTSTLARQDLATPTLVYAMSGVLSSMTGENVAVLRVADRLHLAFAATAVGAAIRIAVLAVALLTDGGLLMITLASAAGAGALGLTLFVAMSVSLRHAGLAGLWRSFSVWVPLQVIRFQLSNFGRSSVDALNKQLDVLLIVGLTSVAQLGLYRAVHQIVDATRRVFEALGQGVQSEYSKLWFAGDGAAVRHLATRFTALAAVLGAASYALLAMLHEPVIRIVLGVEFEAAATPLLIMIPGAVAFACVAALHTLPAATGRALPHFVVATVALVVQVIAIIALAPAHGADGAAWANTFYYLAFALLMIPFCLRTWRRSRAIAPPPADVGASHAGTTAIKAPSAL